MDEWSDFAKRWAGEGLLGITEGRITVIQNKITMSVCGDVVMELFS